MVLIEAVFPVFSFISSCFDCFPAVIKTLVFLSFGGVIYIAVLKGIGR